MNLGKTNLFFGYLHILSAFSIAILSYLHQNKLKVDTDLYRYEADSSVIDENNFTFNASQQINISTQTIQILITLMFCIAGFFHLFYFSNGFYTRSYLEDIRGGCNRYRWLEYSITSAIMVFILGILAGVKDIYAVVLNCVLMSSLCVIGFFIERSSKKSDKTIGLIAGGVIMTTILSLFYVSYFSIQDELRKQNEWITGLLIGSGITLIAIGIVTILYVGGYAFSDFDYIMYEKLYTYLSFFAKAYLGYYVTYGILK